MRFIWLVALAACSAPAADHPTIANHDTGPVDAPRTDEEVIARQILDDYVAKPDSLPDHGLLPVSGPIFVLSEVNPQKVLRPAMLPSDHFELRTAAELQAEANRRQDNIAYVQILVRVQGDRAEVSEGVDILLPQRSQQVKMCCCSSSREYVKRAGHWAPNGPVMTMCS